MADVHVVALVSLLAKIKSIDSTPIHSILHVGLGQKILLEILPVGLVSVCTRFSDWKCSEALLIKNLRKSHIDLKEGYDGKS